MKHLSVILALLSIIYFFDSCCKGCPDDNPAIIVEFKNFSENDVDSFTLKSYTKGSDFAEPSISTEDIVVQKGGEVSTINLYNTRDFDWEIIMKNSGSIYRFGKPLYKENVCRSCGGKDIYASVMAFEVNGQITRGYKYVITKE